MSATPTEVAGAPTAAKGANRGPEAKVGYTHLESPVYSFSSLTYTEALEDEKATTTIGFSSSRTRAFFADHGITQPLRAVTDRAAN